MLVWFVAFFSLTLHSIFYMSCIMQFEKIKNWFHCVPDGYKRYSGKYHNGYAVYIYREEEGERVFHGPFSFEVMGGMGSRYAIKGQFENNRKVGVWTFSHSGKTVGSTMEVTFERGHCTGNFYYTERRMNMSGNAIPTDVSFVMDDGRIQGEINAVLDGRVFKGQCNDDGMPDGIWLLQHNNNEKRPQRDYEEWEAGYLLKAYLKSGDNGSVKETEPHLRQLINMVLDNDCLRLLNFVPRGSFGPFAHIPCHKSKKEEA